MGDRVEGVKAEGRRNPVRCSQAQTERLVRVERTGTDPVVALGWHRGGKIYRRILGVMEKNKMTNPLLPWLDGGPSNY